MWEDVYFSLRKVNIMSVMVSIDDFQISHPLLKFDVLNVHVHITEFIKITIEVKSNYLQQSQMRQNSQKFVKQLKIWKIIMSKRRQKKSKLSNIFFFFF